MRLGPSPLCLTANAASNASPKIGSTTCASAWRPDVVSRCGARDSHRQRRTAHFGAPTAAQTATVNSPSPRGLLRYAAQCLGLEKYLRQPGDGRPQPRIAARTLLWSMLIARLLREISFHAVEQLVHSCCRALCVPQSFGDDALGYFTERLDPAVTRAALIGVLHRAKRNKAFQDSRFVGLAIDGTTAGHSIHRGCEFCRPQHNAKKEVIGYSHQMVSIRRRRNRPVASLRRRTLRPWRQRVCRRPAPARPSQEPVGRSLCRLPGGRRRVCYGSLSARLRSRRHSHHRSPQGQPPGTFSIRGTALRRCFSDQSLSRWQRPCGDLGCGRLRPWETLRWDRVRVIRYRQHKPDQTTVQAQWLTNLPSRRVGSLSLYQPRQKPLGNRKSRIQ